MRQKGQSGFFTVRPAYPDRGRPTSPSRSVLFTADDAL